MNEPHNTAGSNPFGRVRTIPVHTNEPVSPQAQTTALNKDEPGANPASQRTSEPVSFEEVWLTVDEAVAYCEGQGLSRTAKTIRKWAERSFNVPEGEVVSRREDTLWGRYRWKIELRSLERKVAEELSREADVTRELVQTGANTQAKQPNEISQVSSPNVTEPVRTSADEVAKVGLEKSPTNSNEPLVDVRTRATSLSVSDVDATVLATLKAENKELRKQQDRDLDEIKFLREEVTFNRSLKSDFAQNSQRLLETLETVAIGGRLDRTARSSTEAASEPSRAVRYRTDDQEVGYTQRHHDQTSK